MSSLLCGGIFVAGMIVPCFFSTEVFMVFVGMIVASVVIMAIVAYCYPRWFKDYIDYCNKGGVDSEDKSNKESNSTS